MPPSAPILATSQQSRFHADTLDTSTEIDLQGVTVSIGERELVSASHLRLKAGVRYALVGRNGSGKSTLLTAVAEKLVPGIGVSIRILLLSQVEDSVRATKAKEGEDGGRMSVLQHVVQGDKERLKAMEQFQALTKAVESPSLLVTERTVRKMQLDSRRTELVEAEKIASRRSGARGKDARAEVLKAEKRVKDAEETLAAVGSADPPADILSQAVDMLTEVQTTLDLLESTTTEARAASILSGLAFTKEMMDSPYASLSGGWRSRCALAVSLLVQCDILLLDEPTNFLDLEATIWLEHHLVTPSPSGSSRTLVLVSHDQDFLDATVEETVVLRKGALRYFEGTPSAFEVEERKTRKRLVKQQEKLDTKKEHIQESIQKGMASAKKTGDENRQRMVKSRQKKLDERWGVETSAKGTRFKLNRDMGNYETSYRRAIVIEGAEPAVKIVIPDPPKLRTLGDLIHFDNVAFRYPKAREPLLDGVTFTVEQGGRCAFVGANGNGKSTLAKLILGTLTPTKGTITRHPLIKIGYFSQHSVEELTVSPASSAQSALSYFLEHFEARGTKVAEQEARQCLGSCGLQGRVASDTPIAALSGGQKVRLAFALLIFHPPSLLLLDELTTHVDAPTIRALASALRKFTGGIIMITHDRWFSRVVVEGAPPRPTAGDDGDDASDEESSEEDESGAATGKTYLVGGGKVKLLEKGMGQYVRLVERRLERRRKLEGGG